MQILSAVFFSSESHNEVLPPTLSEVIFEISKCHQRQTQALVLIFSFLFDRNMRDEKYLFI